MRDFTLNTADTLDVTLADLPAGWTRRTSERHTDDGRTIEEVFIVPPVDSLRGSDLLSDDFFAGDPLNFDPAELDRMRRVLDDTAIDGRPAQPSLSGLAAFRFNRVEALSAGLRHSGPLWGGLTGWGEIRLGAGDLVPNAEAGLRRGLGNRSVQASAYYRLQAANDWGEPLNLESSVNALLLGYDMGEYYRAGGLSAELRDESGRLRWELRGFAEAQRAEEKHTDISLANLLGRDDPPENVVADEIEVAGVAARLRAQWGVDPAGWVWTAAVWGEAGVGGAEYGRIATGITTAHPLFWRLAASLQGSIGTTFGDVPAQRLYYVAGPQVLRAFEAGQVAGESFWQTRAELALGYPAFRVVTFGDFAWAGDRARFGTAGHAVAVGAGVSALDGILRIDLAKGVEGPGPLRWQLHVYLDALL